MEDGNSAVAVKFTGVKELKDACTAGPLSMLPSVQVTCVWPLELVVAGVVTVPPELPGVNTELAKAPGVKVTVWPLTGLPLVSANITTSGEGSWEFTSADWPLPDTMVNAVAVPASDVSVNVVEAVAPVVSTCAVTVLICALVPAVNVIQACPFDPLSALLPTDDAPVVVGVTEKLTVAPTMLLLLLVTSAQS